MSIQLPTIHLNGSGAQGMADGYCAAMCAVNDALEKVAEAGPNARDDYPQGQPAIDAALAQHRDRCDRLRAVAAELEQLARHCANHVRNRA